MVLAKNDDEFKNDLYYALSHKTKIGIATFALKNTLSDTTREEGSTSTFEERLPEMKPKWLL